MAAYQPLHPMMPRKCRETEKESLETMLQKSQHLRKEPVWRGAGICEVICEEELWGSDQEMLIHNECEVR